MKKLLLLIFSLFFTDLTISADNVEINGIFYDLKPVKVGTASVTMDPTVVNGKLYKGSVVIPSEIEHEGNTYKVTEIDRYAFMGCHELTSVELPLGLTTIGFGAFDGCNKLSTINIPSTVTIIKQWGFRDCTNLSAINITSIEAWCSIVFEDYGNPLYYAHHLVLNGTDIEHLVIPDNVTSIGNRAFNGFSNLKTVELSSGITSIGSYAFAWCTSLTSLSLPNTVTEIGDYAFTECTSLNSLELSGSVGKISNHLFDKCSGLEEVRIPNGVKEIETSAFANCTNLKKIYIAESVEKMGASSFGDCKNISDVYCFATTPPIPNTMYYNTLSNYFWNSYVDYSTLHVPQSSIDTFKKAFSWQDFGTIVALTEEDTAVKPFFKEKDEKEYYTIGGMSVNRLQKGVNIIRMKDGKTIKVNAR